MKQKLLLKAMLLLCALVAGSSSVWADTAGFTLTGKPSNVTNGTSTSGTITGTKNETWSWSSTHSTSSPYHGTLNSAWQLGKNGDNCTALSFSTDGIAGTITKIEVTCAAYGTSSVSAKVGGSNFGTQNQSLSSTSATKTFTKEGGASGEILISFTNSSRYIVIKSIIVTYTPSSSPISVTSVSVDPTSCSLLIGQTKTLTASVSPSTATNKNVTWSTTDGTVATVSNGVVTAVGVGTATIRVTTVDGSKTADCEVTVNPWSLNLTTPIVISDWSTVNSSYYTSDTYVDIEGYTFKLLQCCKQTYLQMKGGSGVLTSPTINSTNGFTVIIESATGSNNSGVLTLQIGNETAVTVTGPNKTVMATTSATSTSFTIKNLSSNVMKLGKITIVPNQYSTTVQSYGWATYIAPAPIEFAANTAYVVTAASVSAGLTLEAITKAPAGTPLLLKGEGEKTITVVASATAPTTNLLTVCDGTIASGKYPYVLAKNGTSAAFKQWTGEASVLNGRVVLLLDEAVAASSPVFALDGETTGINTLNVERGTMNGEVYNLNGQRVAQPTKGLYIVNGKKVIVK